MNNTMKKELSDICQKRGLSIEWILAKCRQREVVAARNEAIFFLRINYGLSLERIGKIFNMHHSSISHAINRHLYAD